MAISNVATFDPFNRDLVIWSKQAAYTNHCRLHLVSIPNEAVAIICLRREIAPYSCPFPLLGEVPDQPVGDPKRFWPMMQKLAKILNVRI